jgi:DNA-binding XRE family transcriptional regulator
MNRLPALAGRPACFGVFGTRTILHIYLTRCKLDSLTIDLQAVRLSVMTNLTEPHAASGLRQLRREQGLTLDAVGVLSGRDPATISRIERGIVRPNPSTVVRVARALGISVSRLRKMMHEQDQAVAS